MSATKLAIHGAAGRMGRRLIALAAADPHFQLVGAWENAGHVSLGQDAGALAGIEPIGLSLSAQPSVAPDVVIDFSVPEASAALVERCAERGWPAVVATTGFSAEQKERIARAGQRIALLVSPNLSFAVNLAMKLADVAAAALAAHPGQVDVEIIERHHRFKEDSPSGTALKFGEIVSARMGQQSARHGREGRPGARPAGEIGYHAVRAGDHPGEHEILFGLIGESVEIRVAATNRDAYATGALAAARQLVGKPPGLYSTAQVFGL